MSGSAHQNGTFQCTRSLCDQPGKRVSGGIPHRCVSPAIAVPSVCDLRSLLLGPHSDPPARSQAERETERARRGRGEDRRERKRARGGAKRERETEREREGEGLAEGDRKATRLACKAVLEPAV